MLNAEAPDRFSNNFLIGLGFKSTNDRLLIGILKELGFLNTDGAPQDRYYQFLDKSKSAKVVADGVKEAYSDLFAVNKNANEMDAKASYNKLRTLYKGAKKDTVVKLISKTFAGLCTYADFSQSSQKVEDHQKPVDEKILQSDNDTENNAARENSERSSLGVKSLQYHINIVLPDTRDSSVYDAIFKSLRDHLG